MYGIALFFARSGHDLDQRWLEILEVVKRQQKAIDELREELQRLRTQREGTPD